MLEFPVLPPGFWSGSHQSLTFFIEPQVRSINLSNDVNFILEKSSLHAGIGSSAIAVLPIELETASELPNKI